MLGNRQAFDLAMKRGRAFARQRAWSKAVLEYKRALAEFSDEVEALLALATALIGLNQWPDALDALQHANQVRPGDVATLSQIAAVQEQLGRRADAAQTMIAVGNLLAQREQIDQAVDAWLRAGQLDPDNIEAHQILASTYQAQGQPRLAVHEMLALVKIYQKSGQFDQAAQQCQAALALDPRNTDALKLMDTIRVERGTGALPPLPGPHPAPAAVSGELEAAITEKVESASPVDITSQKALAELAEFIFEETPIVPRPEARGAAARLTKSEIDALIGQALDLQTRGQNQQAIAAYQRILEVTELPAARFNMGLLYEQEMHFEEAIEQFMQSVEHAEYALGSHFALGECYRALGQIDQGLRHFIQALKIVDLGTVKREQADDLIAVYDNLADAYTKGDRDQALRFTNALVDFLSSKGWEDKVKEARQRLDSLTDAGAPVTSLAEMLNVSNVEVILQSLALTQEYIRRGQTYAALEEAYTALSQAPDYLPMHRCVADILWNGGHQEAAIAKYLAIAEAYLARGSYRHAVTIYQRVLRLTPMDVQTRSKLISVLIEHGEIDQAIEQYMALADAHYQLAQIDLARETYQEAMKYTSRASDGKSWTCQILHRMGDIDSQRLDWRRAIQDYQQIKSLAPDDDRARLALIELYFKVGDSVRAIKELDELLISYSTTGRASRIIPALEEQTQNHPNEMGLRMRLARAYIGAGMNAQAVEQLDALGELQLQAGLRKEAATTIRGIIALNPPNVEQYRQVLAQISTTGPL